MILLIKDLLGIASCLSALVMVILSLPKILEIHTDNPKKEDKNVLG